MCGQMLSVEEIIISVPCVTRSLSSPLNSGLVFAAKSPFDSKASHQLHLAEVGSEAKWEAAGPASKRGESEKHYLKQDTNGVVRKG